MHTAIIMAGGRSQRMRATFGGEHKALVEILGLNMLERNILTLLSHGFREVYLAINAGEKSLLARARGSATQIARAGGAVLKICVEEQQLGTIGAAAMVGSAAGDVLVVNVDNLTSLDLSKMWNYHQTEKPVMTIATHIEQFRIPFGQVLVNRGTIVDYREKPSLPVTIASGVYVLSKEARQAIPLRTPCGAPHLVEKLLRQKRRVASFPHSSAWIDVNDSLSIDRAEVLLKENSRAFELWKAPPDGEVAVLCILRGKTIAVTKIADQMKATRWSLPTARITESVDVEKTVALLQGYANVPFAVQPELLVSFDELAIETGTRTRYHVLVAKAKSDIQAKGSATNKAVRWLQIQSLSSAVRINHGISRTTAYLKQYLDSQNPHSVSH